jgi:hypothetical protein
VQLIELSVTLMIVIPLFIIGTLRLRRSNAHPAVSLIVVALISGILGAFIVLVLRTDLVPDGVEAVLIPILLLFIVPLVLLVAWRYRRGL